MQQTERKPPVLTVAGPGSLLSAGPGGPRPTLLTSVSSRPRHRLCRRNVSGGRRGQHLVTRMTAVASGPRESKVRSLLFRVEAREPEDSANLRAQAGPRLPLTCAGAEQHSVAAEAAARPMRALAAEGELGLS